MFVTCSCQIDCSNNSTPDDEVGSSVDDCRFVLGIAIMVLFFFLFLSKGNSSRHWICGGGGGANKNKATC